MAGCSVTLIESPQPMRVHVGPSESHETITSPAQASKSVRTTRAIYVIWGDTTGCMGFFGFVSSETRSKAIMPVP